MIRFAVRRSTRWSKLVQAVALGALTSIVYSGCVGGGGSGGGSGISSKDDHGDTALTATVVLPDGANIIGQINYPRSPERPADIDFFRFRGIQGIVYTIQILGFPPDPDVRLSLDLTGDGDESLFVQLLGLDGTTQIQNTTGNQGGDPYDINVAGFEFEDNEVGIGDSRITFAAVITGDYYLRLSHPREDTGIGAYEIRVASSQLAEIQEEDSMFQSGSRFVRLETEQDGVFFNNTVSGAVVIDFFEIQESLGDVNFAFSFGFSPGIIFPGQDDPADGAVHIHVGQPNNFFPGNSQNFQVGTPHPFISSTVIPAGDGRSIDGIVSGNLTLSDGTLARFPIEVKELEPTTSADGMTLRRAAVSMHLGDAVDARGEEVELGADDLRLITGFPWYLDVHPQTNYTLDPLPVATSRPYGGVYQIWETTFGMDPGNVVPDSGVSPADRGFPSSPLFNIYYDSSLKLFQVATQSYQSGFFATFFGDQPGFNNPDYTDFVGDRVRVREGQPGENGKVLIDLGTLPTLKLPPTAFPPDFQSTKFEEPGFRAPIRQLTDEEAEKLRDAFYDDRGGFYIEVTDARTQQRIARAEGRDLEISFFPSEGRCGLPPCDASQDAAAGPTTKGVVNFASALPGNVKLDVYANGKLLGVLKDAVDANALPACGLGGDNRTLAAEFWPETYYWRAYGSDGKTYDGHVTVSADGCQTVVITPADADE